MAKHFQPVLITFAFMLCGCMKIVQSVLGIKDAHKLSDVQIVKVSKKFKIDQSSNFRLDTTYFSYIIGLDTGCFKAQRKNHIQPLQALYFNQKSELKKFYINCYAGGFPNIKSNRNRNLETFLPKDQAPTDTVLNLAKQINFLQPVSVITVPIKIENYGFYVFVYWNKCTRRHSKKLLHRIKQNVAKAKNLKVKLIYVNYDNVFYKLENR